MARLRCGQDVPAPCASAAFFSFSDIVFTRSPSLISRRALKGPVTISSPGRDPGDHLDHQLSREARS